jgi:hypothetical protein
MSLWIIAIVCMVASAVVAGVLALRLEKADPDLYRVVDSPLVFERNPPFWLYHFLSPSKRARLAPSHKAAAAFGLVLLSCSLALMIIALVSFLRRGSL